MSSGGARGQDIGRGGRNTNPLDNRQAFEAEVMQARTNNAGAGLWQVPGQTTAEKVLDAINDNTIDDVSKREIADLYESNWSLGTKVPALIAAAREGKGIFAVRKINQAQQDIQKAMPGRQQTVSSVGYGSVI